MEDYYRCLVARARGEEKVPCDEVLKSAAVEEAGELLEAAREMIYEGTVCSLDWFAGVASVRVSDNATSVAVTNSPNPVVDMTKFTYSVTEPTVVSLAVYDVMGREVARVVSNESHSMGTYEAEFDASKLANGNYTYVIFAGDEKVTGTMIVQK